MLRCWQAACGNGDLPPYEELTLGSFARFADDIAVLRRGSDGATEILRAGPGVRGILGMKSSTCSLSDTATIFAMSIGAALEAARQTRSPQQTLCRWLVEGRISTIEIVAAPLDCRWTGDYAILFMRARSAQTNLAKLLVNATQEGIMGLSPVEDNGRGERDLWILSINEAAARFFGSRADALQFTLLSDCFARLGLGRLPEPLLRAASGARMDGFELTYRLDGAMIVLKVGVDARDGILVVTLTDVRDIKASETLFRSLFDRNPVPMYVRAHGSPGFANVNDAALALYGHDRESFLRLGVDDLRAGGGALAVATDGSEDLARHRRRDGTEIDVIECSSEIMIDRRPATLTTIVDITERRRAEAHVTYLAHHDPLTGAANRTVFTREIERAFGAIEEDRRPFAVILVDLDDFKIVNDTLGHSAGDGLLVEITRRLRDVVAKGDVVARLGGDEFAVLLLSAPGREEVERIARRLASDVAAIRVIEGTPVVVGASIGIAMAPGDAGEPDELLKRADLALYRAKGEAKGSYRFFEPEMDVQVQERRLLEMELNAADPEREFELHYQPILSARTGRLRGFEALLRWRNPRRGLVSPAEFIPIAEKAGTIDRIGRWVLIEACRQAAAWPRDLVLAVNVSPVQFRKSRLVDAVESALARSGLAPDRLEIEITESVLLDHTEANIATLSRLRGRGVRIALDDFGTGYAGLPYLRQFRFSRLKIDRSFIRDLEHSDETVAIVRAIIGLGQSLGIDITAEGVETVAQLERLREERCGELQGYLFSAPVETDCVADIIAAFYRDADPDRVELSLAAATL
jgi:diguanylate cyclase (GGDEF)-like protein/PAS domain S-box-containing protein